MHIKLKFPPDSTAFFIKSESEFQKIKIKESRIIVNSEGVKIECQSFNEGEMPFDEKILLDKREFFDHVNSIN